MPHARHEAHLGGCEWVLRVQLDVHPEHAPLIGCVLWAGYAAYQVLQVVVDHLCCHARGFVTVYLLQLLLQEGVVSRKGPVAHRRAVSTMCLALLLHSCVLSRQLAESATHAVPRHPDWGCSFGSDMCRNNKPGCAQSPPSGLLSSFKLLLLIWCCLDAAAD